MKLITELYEDLEVVSEGTDAEGKKNLFIEGVYLQAGIKNKNGRLYPEAVMEKEVARYMKEEVNRKKAYGELNHPPTPQIDLERACIRICELRQDGKNYIGKSIVLNTPMGNIVRGLLEGDCNLGVSSRGMGTLKQNGMVTEVQADFRLATAADVVSNPSAPDAFVNGIMENVEWVLDPKLGWQANELVTEIKNARHKQKLTEAQMFQAFQAFVARVQNVQIAG